MTSEELLRKCYKYFDYKMYMLCREVFKKNEYLELESIFIELYKQEEFLVKSFFASKNISKNKIFLFGGIAMFLTSCSFQVPSDIRRVSSLANVISPTTSLEITGAASHAKSIPDPLNGPGGNQAYSVSQSAGQTFKQDSIKAVDENYTESGYKVFSSVSMDAQ